MPYDMNDIAILEKLAEFWEPRLRNAFIQAVQEIRTGIDISTIVKYFEEGRTEEILRAMNIDTLDFRRLDIELTNAFNAGGESIIRALPKKRADGAVMRIGFDARNPSAEHWIKTHSSTLIVQITDDIRDAVRNRLEAGLIAGENPRTVALDLVGRINKRTNRREGGVIGLTTQQEAWVRNYARELSSGDPVALQNALERALRDKRFDASVRKAIADKAPVPLETRAKMLSRYRSNALLYRGTNIARTEALAALSEAQHQAMQQAIDNGAIDGKALRRFWHTARDERVRDSHRKIPGMNPQGRAMQEMFSTPDGPAMKPPFGVNCRCTVHMKIDFLAGIE